MRQARTIRRSRGWTLGAAFIVLPGLAFAVAAGAPAGGGGEGPFAVTRGGGPVTFAEDVAPILHARCADCHRPGGSAPFDLLTYDDAVAEAEAIVEAVADGRMPPWLPAEGDVRFEGDRRLAAEERSVLLAWVEKGMPAGDLGSVPLPEFAGGWELGEPDRIVRTAEPYPVPAAGRDVFRNLVIGTELEERVWVRGMEIRFSDPAVVHHAMVTLDVTRSSRRMAARDPEPGFDGMFASTEALGPSGFLLGWTPGHEPTLAPDDFAFPLDPGTDIILQLHLRPMGRAAAVSAEIGVFTAGRPPNRTPFTLRLGVEEIDIAPGDSAYTLTDDYRLPVDIELRGLYPHAHYVGKSIRLRAALPDSTRLLLLDIPRWDFNWQDAYRLETPLPLPAGTRLEARFTYDNSAANPRNPHDPPRRVLYGPSSEDEMGEIWLQVVPAREEELETLAADFGREDLASKVRGWEHTLSVRPGEPTALTGLGTLDQARGLHGAAARKFREALENRPDYVVARYNLAVSLDRLGRLAEAEREYRRVLEDDPEHPGAHNNLGLRAARTGDLSTAADHFRRAAEAEPLSAEAHNNLGNTLRRMGDLERAARQLLHAHELEPGYAAARLNLALVAWIRATAPEEARRDGAEAVRLAEAAVDGDESGDPRLLDVLGAAYAEAGRFEEAAAAARRALELGRASERAAAGFLEEVEARIALYESGRPFRSP